MGFGMYYHFLRTKEEEEENNRRSFDLSKWVIVEKNNRLPQLLHLFPWAIKKVITPQDVEHQFGLELNARQVKEHLLKYWDVETRQLLRNGESIPVIICDLDTNSEHSLLLKRWPYHERYSIQGDWIMEFVERRNLRPGMTVGMYWDAKSKVLRFSILENPPC